MFNIVIKPHIVLILTAIWCYVFNQTLFLSPTSAFLFYGLLSGICIAYFYLYRKCSFKFELTKYELKVLGVIVGLNLLMHFQGLFYSLGGDELYHARQASAILVKLGLYVNSLPGLDFESHRENLTDLFNLRHFPIIDIWRVISVGIVLAALFYVHVENSMTQERKRLTRILLLMALFCVGTRISLPPEQHPPLRLLPLFLSQLVFGLNNFAFRFPQILAVSLAAFLFYLTVSRLNRSQLTNKQIAIASLVTCFIPIVFYVAEAVEPSAYGYLVCVATLLLCVCFITTQDCRVLILSGLVVGLGCLLRQSTIYLWAPIFVLHVCSKKRFDSSQILMVFSPAILSLPYFYTASKLQHAALNDSAHPLKNVINSMLSGIGPIVILNTTTLAWALVTLILLIFCILKAKRREMLLFLSIIPAYCMFYSIWEFLWGIGRYQAEYVAPFIVLALLYFVTYLSRKLFNYSLLVFAMLCISTLEVNSNLSLDINYKEWPKMRISTSASFPYRDALGYLKREESLGRFVYLGGSPWYNQMSLWLAGFSYAESFTWENLQNEFGDLLNSSTTPEQIRAFMKTRDVRYLVVSTGTRKERQHRSVVVAKLIESLETIQHSDAMPFVRERSFSGEHGGILDVYVPKSY